MSSSQSFRALLPGEPAPWYRGRCTSNEAYNLDLAAGRYIVLCFYGSLRNAGSVQALERALAHPLFNDRDACLFAVSIEPAEEKTRAVHERLPGFRVFWDHDLELSKLYGSVSRESSVSGPKSVRAQWVIVGPSMRIINVYPFSQTEAFLSRLDGLPPWHLHAGFEIFAPVLVLPDVLEPAICRDLIGLYEHDQRDLSGFMTERNGMTVGKMDAGHKVRRDFLLEDPEIKAIVNSRVSRRINPEIKKVHNFECTRMERYLIGCYSAEDGGHFRAHRDNTTKGTAHRRYAVSINLNGDFDGGEVSFPEYGPRSYKAPPGGAVVFSCPLLHAVSKVTRGKRYAFLPFLYDEAAAKLREELSGFLDDSPPM